MSERRIVTAASTDVGLRRSGNEDCHALWEAPDGEPHPADLLVVVCDGMGGSNAGEVASRMTVDAVLRSFAGQTGGDAGEALAEAIRAANAEILDHTRARADLRGMGTTCTTLALDGDRVTVGHVGDSRAYLVRGGRIRQITQDHSLVAQLVASNQLTPEEARRDSRRNVVTRSVGVTPELEVDIVRLGEPLRPGDTLLVCSDGLHTQVDDEELARIASGESLDRACGELIALANERGGPDNITVALARFEPNHAPPPGSSSLEGAPASRRPPLRIVGLIALLLAVCVLAWVVLRMLRR